MDIFGEKITLKVKVAKIELNKVKVGQKLAKTPQLSITLKVGLTFSVSDGNRVAFVVVLPHVLPIILQSCHLPRRTKRSQPIA